MRFFRKKSSDSERESRQRMVEEQIIARGVGDLEVIAAMEKVPRHLFVPEPLRPEAYEDRPLTIGHGQTISQPYMVACMTQALHLTAQDRVLEIGLGSGYQAAVLAEIVKEVYSLEVVSTLASEAKKRLAGLGYHNIFVRASDGYEGWQEMAPFDAIMVTAAPEDIPGKLIEQLKVGGRMVIPVGDLEQKLYLVTKTPSGIKEEMMFPVRFVPMVHRKNTNL